MQADELTVLYERTMSSCIKFNSSGTMCRHVLQSCDVRGLECLSGCQTVIDDARQHPCFTLEVDGFGKEIVLPRTARWIYANTSFTFDER